MTQPPPPPLPPPPPFAPPPFPPPVAPAPRRGKTLAVVLAVVVALVLVTAAVVVPLLLTRDDDEASAGPSDLSAVKSYDGLTNKHVPLGQSLDYPQSPPVGGDHAPVWIECGAYDEPLPEVNAVHDLEHGTTWLTYRPDDVDADGVARLTEPASGERPAVAVPGPGHAGRDHGLGPPGSRWTGRTTRGSRLFIDAYGAGDTAPEPFASCNGGARPEQVPDPGVSA
ncbi:DUF3105 domain-containing protein [Nocardioides sp. W3-2-3]|uniref:DUF3105 domain-containing protein n=1 Tax=Nocardioides convexus TaxID=2712224 RepID=UPI0024183D59|nr:DUF3105 domain-containing protein [Nocardioides convexus]NGZ99921.1 DUF3105 domain-containing protein [Nocardioides convexus]